MKHAVLAAAAALAFVAGASVTPTPVEAQEAGGAIATALADPLRPETDTARDGWSIASGNYSSRFAPAVCGAIGLAATQMKDKLARCAA